MVSIGKKAAKFFYSYRNASTSFYVTTKTGLISFINTNRKNYISIKEGEYIQL